MTNLLFVLLLNKEAPLSSYTCTSEQLKTASEVFIPCRGEKHFQECYEASIREYCEVRSK